MQRVKPFGGVLTGNSCKSGVNFKIVAADELANLLFALDHHGQGRRLHPADRGEKKSTITRVKRRHGASAVDTDQPVGL